MSCDLYTMCRPNHQKGRVHYNVFADRESEAVDKMRHMFPAPEESFRVVAINGTKVELLPPPTKITTGDDFFDALFD